jgi:TonB family protein
MLQSFAPGQGARTHERDAPEEARMIPIPPHRSRLDPDVRVHVLALAIACALHLLLVFLLVPADVRHESTERTAMRFALPGPTQYGEIRVHLVPVGDGGGIGTHRLMGALTTPTKDAFNGKVVVAESHAARQKTHGEAGESVISSEEGDAVRRLRLLHGYLPTAQTSDVAARTISKPEYPEEARTRGIEGLVVVVALVDENGRVEDVALEHGVDPLLDQAAIHAAYRTVFYPYVLDGVAQAVFVRMPYRFELVGTLVE